MLLQLLDERRLGKARLRLRGVRHTLNRCNVPLRTLWQVRNLRLGIFVFVIATFEIDGGEARLKRSRRNSFQAITPCAPNEGGGCGELVGHLRRDRAAPDQRVDLQLAFVDVRRGKFGGEGEIGWTNRFVGLLCVLRLRGVLAATLNNHLWAESLADYRRGVTDGLLAQRW